jgi:hypothetical protein
MRGAPLCHLPVKGYKQVNETHGLLILRDPMLFTNSLLVGRTPMSAISNSRCLRKT